MLAIILLVVSLTLSLTITRVGTVALVLTGMSHDAAHFQARSAFYGVGFTTKESETAVSHPVRRRIITLLMLLGNIGIATVVASVMGSLFTTSSAIAWLNNLLVLSTGLASLVAAANSRWLDRVMSRLVTTALRRWTKLHVQDYVALLHLSDGYTVLEIQVQPEDWLAGMTLKDLKRSHERTLVLGLHRPGEGFLGAPNGQTRILPHDMLVIYGPIQQLQELTERRTDAADLLALQLSVALAERVSQGQKPGEINGTRIKAA